MRRTRVVVTGLGIVSPLGLDVPSTWKAIVNGVSGAEPIEAFDAKTYTTRFDCPVKGFDVEGYFSHKDARRMDDFLKFGIVAGIQALRDSELEITDENCRRVGLAVGSGIGGLESIANNTELLCTKGPGRVSPFFIPGTIINMIAGNLSVMCNMRGPNLALATACSSGTHNIGLGARLIAAGDADAMLVGGSEMTTVPTALSGFSAMRALSTRNEDPMAASRPWDADRDGFVLGSGAAALMLESLDSAKKRGGRIYAELAGFGMSGDAYHITMPSKDGRGAAESMQNALCDARLNPEEINYVNAHGTSTLLGDIVESKALQTVFGDVASDLAISSTKSMTGHLLGAAGAIEAIFTILAIRDGIAPPTINLDNLDKEVCHFNYVPHTAQEIPIRHALSNSFGFGGTNGSLLFSKYE